MRDFPRKYRRFRQLADGSGDNQTRRQKMESEAKENLLRYTALRILNDNKLVGQGLGWSTRNRM